MGQPFGATNEPLTCLWCGRKLPPRREWTDKEAGESYVEWKARRRKAPIIGYGRNNDGFFCGLTCGYLFGRQFAGFGRRLRPKDPA